jgi:hypothetical protein
VEVGSELSDEQRREVEEAFEYAHRRFHTLGEGTIADVETLAWPGDGIGPSGGRLRRNPDVTLCFARITRGRREGELCDRPAGAGTEHPGVGRCSSHGGDTPEGRREGAWIVAHAFALALDVTPWEGLLTAVRIAAGRVAYIEAKLATAEVDRQLEPPKDNAISEAGRVQDQQGTNMHHWVKQAEYWTDRLAKVSKMAIDAGVAERMVRQLELEAQLMLRATNLTLDELGLDEEQRQRALVIMSRNLLRLERRELAGEVLSEADEEELTGE